MSRTCVTGVTDVTGKNGGRDPNTYKRWSDLDMHLSVLFDSTCHARSQSHGAASAATADLLGLASECRLPSAVVSQVAVLTVRLPRSAPTPSAGST